MKIVQNRYYKRNNLVLLAPALGTLGLGALGILVLWYSWPMKIVLSEVGGSSLR